MSMNSKIDTTLLCYVSGVWAYFTTQSLENQTGYDLDDAPYEHNAAAPYRWAPPLDDGMGHHDKPWHITRLAWEGPFWTPAEWIGTGNSPFSVNMINTGYVPWLIPHPGNKGGAIYAGAPQCDFIKTVKAAGGTIYQEID